jgi:hypothetical protein
MDSKSKKLVDRRARLLRRLAGLQLVVHGSFVERFSTCAREHCACHRGEKHGPRAYVVVYREGRQRQVYVPKAQIRAVQKALGQDARVQELLRQITDINLALMRAGVLEESLAPAPKEESR